MKLPVKSIGIFVCGAAIASLPYTLSLGKANAQGTTTSTSNSTSKNGNASSSAQAGSSQYSSSSSSRNSSANDMANQLARAAQNASSGGSSSGGSSNGEMPIMALTNDDQFVYAAVGNTIHKIKKSDMSSVTFVPLRRAEPNRP